MRFNILKHHFHPRAPPPRASQVRSGAPPGTADELPEFAKRLLRAQSDALNKITSQSMATFQDAKEPKPDGEGLGRLGGVSRGGLAGRRGSTVAPCGDSCGCVTSFRRLGTCT